MKRHEPTSTFSGEREGHEALELLRDGESSEALTVFAMNTCARGHYTEAISYLRRGLEYLQRTRAGAEETVDAYARPLRAELQRAACLVDDVEALEWMIATAPDPIATMGGTGLQMNEQRRWKVALPWFRRAREAVTDGARLDAHLARFGGPELYAMQRAKVGDGEGHRELAELVVAHVARRRAALDPADEHHGWRVREIDGLERCARRSLNAVGAPPAPPATKPRQTRRS